MFRKFALLFVVPVLAVLAFLAMGMVFDGWKSAGSGGEGDRARGEPDRAETLPVVGTPETPELPPARGAPLPITPAEPPADGAVEVGFYGPFDADQQADEIARAWESRGYRAEVIEDDVTSETGKTWWFVHVRR